MVRQHQIDWGLKLDPPTSTCVTSHVYYDSRLQYKNKSYTVSLYANGLNIYNAYTYNIQQVKTIKETIKYILVMR